jgi:hypothetical protein
MRKLYIILILCSWLSCGHFLFAQKFEWVKVIKGNTSSLDRLKLSIGNNIKLGQVYLPGSNLVIDSIEITPLNDIGGEFYFGTINKTNSKLMDFKSSLSHFSRCINDILIDKEENTFVCGYYTNNLILDTLVYKKDGVGLFLIKYDKSNKVIWTPEIIYTPHSIAKAISMCQDSEGSLYLLGYCNGDIILKKDTLKNCSSFIVKYNRKGEQLWVKKISGYLINQNLLSNMGELTANNNDDITLFFNTQDHGEISFEDKKFPLNSENIFVLRLDKNGNFIYGRLIGNKFITNGNELNEIGDNLYITGVTNGNFNNDSTFSKNDFLSFILSLDKNGIVRWCKFFAKGNAPSITNYNDNLIVAFDFDQTVKVDNFIIEPNSSNLPNIDKTSDICIAVLQTDNGSARIVFKIGGKGSEDLPTIKSDENNLYIFAHLYGTLPFNSDSITAKFGSFLAKISLPELSIKENINTLQASVYPNPTSTDKINIKLIVKQNGFVNLKITDISGKKMQEEIMKLYLIGENEMKINTANYPNGKYFCTIQHDGITETISFVIQK